MSQPPSPLLPTLRALEQFDDPVLLGVAGRSVLWSVGLFAALGWAVQRGLHDWLGFAGWLSGVLGGVGAAVLAWLLFLPVAGLVASLFVDRIARRVEAQFYPWLPPARPAPLAAQAWDGVVLGAQVLLLQGLALLLALPLFGLSLPLGWAVAAWTIGRGLFVAVAMRRMTRPQALACYRARRGDVLLQGALAAAASLLPVANLLVPVVAVAALVHVLHAGGAAPPGLSVARTV